MSWTDAQKADIRIDLRVLYRAGTQRIPGLAKKVSDISWDMSTMVDTINQQSAMLGDNGVVLTSLALAVDCTNGVASTVTTLNNLADGVVRIADDFVATDGYAREQFDKIKGRLGLTDDLHDDENDAAYEPSPIDKHQITAPGADVAAPPYLGGGHIDSSPHEQNPADDQAGRDDDFDHDQDAIPELEGS